jgi:catechol 2,3-dioxygenase-like lactoylglutathione lyase family enzyme/predicted enzyme related to lactoylglutathione lyase
VLGRFLEYSLATPDIRASLDFYAKLGFSQAEVGEVWNHPYAVLTDGRLCLGLHQQTEFVPSVTFVKPDLLRHLEEFEKRGAAFEFRHLGNDVFNEIGWPDPGGHLIRLIEARTFSPSKRSDLDTSLCGYFAELALPAPDLEIAKSFWEQFGFVGMDELDASLPHVACTSDTIEIGLYDPAQLPAPTLLFDVDDLQQTLAALNSNGIMSAGRLPAPLRGTAALLQAPEGTAILVRTSPPSI